MAHGAAGSGGGGRTQLLVAVEVPAMTVLTVSSPVFFSLFSFSFSSSFTSFSSLGSLLSIPFLLLSSFSLFLFFFPFLFLFSFSSSSVFSFLSLSQFFCLFFFSSLLSLPCIYRQKTRGERPTTSAQSWRSGRATTMQSPQDCPRGASPLFFIVVQ